jgi:hypothetical protein
MIFTEHDPSATVLNLAKDKTVVFDGEAINCRENCRVVGM